MSVKEMMDLQDEVLQKYIQDYKIHLIDPAKLTEEELGKFQSSLKEVLTFIKYSKDEEKMNTFLNTNENMSHMDRMSAEVMRCIGKIPMKIEERGEVDMCKAIDDMMEKREQKGIQEGRKEGKREILMELVRDGVLSAKIAAEKASMSENDFERELEKAMSKG